MVNKSQGQSVKHVGLDLRVPVFSHGQLYVALSRCTSKDRIKVLLPTEANGQTPNIVYQEVLTGVINGMLPDLSVQFCVFLQPYRLMQHLSSTYDFQDRITNNTHLL